MVAWTPKVNRRTEVRYKVAWPATLNGHLADQVESVEARVTEISKNGARLQLGSLSIGAHHIVVESESIRFTLRVNPPEAAFCAPVSIVWYSSSRDKNSFDVGVMFLQNSDERRAAMEKLLTEVDLE